MNNMIIGRKREQKILETCVNSNKSELIAVYGRRRVGKTFLVKKFFNDKFDFYFTGSLNKTKRDMLMLFNEQLCLYSKRHYDVPKNWHQALNQLKDYILTLKKDKIIVFIDEISWIDTVNSAFLADFEYFWNSWASSYGKIKLIICASATSWIIDHFFADRGGLHNRVTRSIGVLPFNLAETEEFFKSKMVNLNRIDIAQCYMIMGGVPFYLDMMEPSLGLVQNIDRLFFEEAAELRKEFDYLYRSLFNDYEFYVKIIECISQKNKGLTRKEISDTLNLKKGGNLTKALRELENCGFIRRYNAFGKVERGALYQVVDFYSLFYLKYCKNRRENDPLFFSKFNGSQTLSAWYGYSFEVLCLLHVEQIKRAIGIGGVITNVCSWNTVPNKELGTEGAQIDLVIDRTDNTINLCEMKFSKAKYAITKRYYDQLNDRVEIFRQNTKTNKTLHTTLVTTLGMKPNMYSSAVQSEVRLDDLFVNL
ncbi:MAG: ATP-binding protein [Bacteroidales bacterium]|nr:ATP-binding protein [Bacteroidales bacterium]